MKILLRGLIFLLLFLLLWGQATGRSAQAQKPTSPFVELAKIGKTYHIEIVTTDPGFPVKNTYGMIGGKPADKKDLENYIGLFAQEFTLYPLTFVKRSLMKRVVLCTDLAFAGQRWNAVPDFEHDTLYLEVSRGSYSKSYLRKVLHHEFFHIVDYREDGSLNQDESWSSLNPSSFKYGSGGRKAQDNAYSSVLTDKYPGFLDYYSTTGVEEDKAEVFANLIVDPVYVENRIKNDAVLRAKVKLMQKQLESFCPNMNAAFWKKVSRMKRTLDWWERLSR